MKQITRFFILAVTLVAGLATVSAQTVQVEVRKKVQTLPATATNYLDDPFRYFDIVFYAVGVGPEGLEIYFDFDYSLNDGSFYLRTDPNKAPTHKITLYEGRNVMSRDNMLDQLRGRKITNVDFSKPLNAQLLPEGTYQLCVDVYRWTDKDDPARTPISIGPCPSYEVCYSGSAPELVSPLAGAQMSLNGTMVVKPVRKINFFWSPVISNCSEKNTTRFTYKLKVVKVLNGQNYNDAIKINPTVFSTEVKNKTFAVLDTLRDIKVLMERGALYVAQVQAEAVNGKMTTFKIANDGKSQPMPFYWDHAGDSSYDFFDGSSISIGKGGEADLEEGEEEDVEEGLTQWEGGVEEESELEGILENAFDEPMITLAPKRHYVKSDGYYTIPVTNDLEVGLKPVRHEALKNVSYEIALYDNIDGDVDSITATEPLFKEKFDKLPESRTLAGWGTKLKQGNLYYLQLKSDFTVNYLKYSIADTSFYVNGKLAEHFHDTISREQVNEKSEYAEGVFFQWGDDPDAPAFMTPQWKAPVDRTGDDIYEPANYVIPSSVPEIQKVKTFPVSWSPVKNVTQGDVVEYEVNVYELKSGQTLEEAVSENKVLVTRTLTNTNEISETDTKFFKVFSPMKTYVMTLTTNVNGESDTIYHFENGNEALPIVIKIVK